MPKSKQKCKTKNISKLKKELDFLFSRFIRIRASENGKARCVSCQRQDNWENLQCGHYISRSHLSVRWSIKNCFPQCISCNIFKNGNYPEFTSYLLSNYGAEWLQDLIREGNKIKKWTLFELSEAIKFYKKELELYG
jgi:hypothetical protein